MKCSFIVSVFSRPQHLRCVLASLEIQSEPDFEVLVTDNSLDPATNARNLSVTEEFMHRDRRFRYLRTALPTCYHSANVGAEHCTGDFLCFPSDDSYYIPTFLERMLSHNANIGADLLYCNCLYGHSHRGYFILDVIPKEFRIDKGGFLIRRTFFQQLEGFKRKTLDRCNADGWMINEAVKRHISHSKVTAEPLWVHNP